MRGFSGILALHLIFDERSLIAACRSFQVGAACSIVGLNQGGLRIGGLACLRSLWRQTLSRLELRSGDFRSRSASRRRRFCRLRPWDEQELIVDHLRLRRCLAVCVSHALLLQPLRVAIPALLNSTLLIQIL